MDASDDLRLIAQLPRLRRFARSLSGEAASADDIVQAAMERALRHWDPQRTDEALQAWLFSIVYRKFVDEHRRARRWQRLLAIFGAAPADAAPDPERIQQGRQMLDLLGRLPAEQRALLLLVSVEGFGYRDAAEMLGVPIGTVMSRLARAREKLRALGEGHVPPPTAALRVLK